VPQIEVEVTELTKRALDAAIETGKEARLWDKDVPSHFARIKPSGAATFFVQYVSPITGKKIRLKLGRYGVLTLNEARRLAKQKLGNVAEGRDPKAEQQALKTQTVSPTFAEFANIYVDDCKNGVVRYRGRPKKTSTIAIDEGRIERHLIPLLGDQDIASISRSDVLSAMDAIQRGETATEVKTRPRGVARVTGGAGTARRTIGLLGSIISHAVRMEHRADNPVHGVERSRDGQRMRTLTPQEYKCLGKALAQMLHEGSNPFAIAAIQALALTGCRKNEILALTHDAIDAHGGCVRLPSTKTGPQARVVGKPALDLLARLPHAGRHVFPASRGDGHLVGGPKIFAKACQAAKLDNVTLHTLRHSFASVALELGYSELTIGSLLGHASHSTTSRYAHHIDRTLREAADRVSKTVAERMEMTSLAGTISELKKAS
jgi:integrase